MDVQACLTALRDDEKAALVAGTDFMFTNPIPRLQIPSLSMADGPSGVRKQSNAKDNGVATSEPATAFPPAVTTASSWNPKNMHRMYAAIGQECRQYGVQLLLGPAINIKRNPLCGRNFEYFSEDPLLAGEMGAAAVQGLQTQGVGACVKHFALNNSETDRFVGDSVADPRAIQEIYLRPFAHVVRQAQPAAIMCAYNRINGIFCAENHTLLTENLRKAWGFRGAVLSDWGAVRDRVAALRAGMDLEMPGDSAVCRKWIIDGLKTGELSHATLNAAVQNVLYMVRQYAVPHKKMRVDAAAHHALAAELAEDSAVLLKNEDVLPLDREKRILTVGELFEKMRYQGAGSSMVRATQVVSPKIAFEQRQIPFTYARGYAENTEKSNKRLIREAVKKAEQADVVLAFVGLTDRAESEGCDRAHMRLPENQHALLDALCATGKQVVVVLFGGAVTELPFVDRVSAILHMFLPGQNGGTAVVRLLFGEVSPSGRLAESWPFSYDDVPFGAEFAKDRRQLYKESIYVGYRYYLTARKPVRYPFGYGLSYTSFSYENEELQQNETAVTVRCTVKNTGPCRGAEVVQLYVQAPNNTVFQPAHELRAFQKIYLNAGESARVTLTVPKEQLRYYHHRAKRWVLADGTYEFRLCSDCTHVLWAQKVTVHGEQALPPYSADVRTAYNATCLSAVQTAQFEQMSGQTLAPPAPLLPIGLNSRFSDLKQTFCGRLLYGTVLSVAWVQRGWAALLLPGPYKENKQKGAMFLQRILDSNSLCSMTMNAAKYLPYNVAQGMAAFANGHPIKAMQCMLQKIKVPPLPKEVTDVENNIDKTVKK